jgi:hypothetical protein
MNPLGTLTWLERLAVFFLQRSPRVSLLVVKTPSQSLMEWSVQRTDGEAIAVMARVLNVEDLEPASLVLERLYHMPAFGEDE